MPEVWRIPPFSHGPKSDPFIVKNNADLIMATWQLGHVRGRVLDATWGYGKWWPRLVAESAVHPGIAGPITQIIGMDKLASKIPPGGVRGDFRRPPFRPGSITTIFYDPAYKLNGSSDKDVGGADEPYGADEEKDWQLRMAEVVDGVASFEVCPECGSDDSNRCPYDCDHCGDQCDRCNGGEWGIWPKIHGLAPLLEPLGKLLVKCQDQVARNHIRWQTDEVTKRAEAAGLTKVDRLDFPRVPRTQRSQVHARQNVSSLLVFQRPKPKRYRRYSELKRKTA